MENDTITCGLIKEELGKSRYISLNYDVYRDREVKKPINTVCVICKERMKGVDENVVFGCRHGAHSGCVPGVICPSQLTSSCLNVRYATLISYQKTYCQGIQERSDKSGFCKVPLLRTELWRPASASYSY
jgi:hypothetical protein